MSARSYTNVWAKTRKYLVSTHFAEWSGLGRADIVWDFDVGLLGVVTWHSWTVSPKVQPEKKAPSLKK
jgi:hypothetical protein